MSARRRRHARSRRCSVLLRSKKSRKSGTAKSLSTQVETCSATLASSYARSLRPESSKSTIRICAPSQRTRGCRRLVRRRTRQGMPGPRRVPPGRASGSLRRLPAGSPVATWLVVPARTVCGCRGWPGARSTGVAEVVLPLSGGWLHACASARRPGPPPVRLSPIGHAGGCPVDATCSPPQRWRTGLPPAASGARPGAHSSSRVRARHSRSCSPSTVGRKRLITRSFRTSTPWVPHWAAMRCGPGDWLMRASRRR